MFSLGVEAVWQSFQYSDTYAELYHPPIHCHIERRAAGSSTTQGYGSPFALVSSSGLQLCDSVLGEMSLQRVERFHSDLACCTEFARFCVLDSSIVAPTGPLSLTLMQAMMMIIWQQCRLDS